MPKLRNLRLSRRNFLLFLGSAGIGVGIPGGLGLRKKLREVWDAKALPRLYQAQRQMMGTWVSLTVFSRHEEVALRGMNDAFEAMKAVDELMSIHKKTSQLSQLNLYSGRGMMPVDKKLFQVLGVAQDYAQKTRGAYDITILPIMKLFGFYGVAPKKVPKDLEIASVLGLVGYESVVIDPEHGTVGLQKTGAAIDLGSIGKGFAVDCAADVLRQCGIRSALINAGGNMYALGAPYEDPDPRSGWRVGIRDPASREASHVWDTLVLRDQAVANSATTYQRIQIGSAEIGHIFDGRSGKPCPLYGCCTAVSRTATDADALSTVGYVLGVEAKRLFESATVKFYFHA